MKPFRETSLAEVLSGQVRAQRCPWLGVGGGCIGPLVGGLNCQDRVGGCWRVSEVEGLCCGENAAVTRTDADNHSLNSLVKTHSTTHTRPLAFTGERAGARADLWKCCSLFLSRPLHHLIQAAAALSHKWPVHSFPFKKQSSVSRSRSFAWCEVDPGSVTVMILIIVFNEQYLLHGLLDN